MLKKYFPFSFGQGLIMGIVKYVLALIVSGLLIWLSTAIVGWIPVVGAVIGWILGIVSSLVGIYVIAGIVILILADLKIIK